MFTDILIKSSAFLGFWWGYGCENYGVEVHQVRIFESLTTVGVRIKKHIMCKQVIHSENQYAVGGEVCDLKTV